jgi:hypothetical protein
MLFQPASDLTPPPIEWLWPGYLANGSLAILDGDPGVGKSLVTLDLTARLTTGRPWPDGAASPGPASVLLLCDEDVESVIIARLKTAGAELPRAFLCPRLTDGGMPRLPSQIDRLDEALAQTGAKLLVIDPIMAFLDRNVDVNTDANARRALRPLAVLAEKHRCVILMVRHLNKTEGPRALYRGGASIAFVAACRLAWLAGRDPKMEGRFILAQPKNNYATQKPSLAYALPTDGPRVEWLSASLWNADDLAARQSPRTVRERAKDFLRAFLAAGPRTSQDLWDAAREQDFSPETLKRARKELEIVCARVVKDGKRFAYWSMSKQELPPGASVTLDADAILRQLNEKYPPANPLDEMFEDFNIGGGGF